MGCKDMNFRDVRFKSTVGPKGLKFNFQPTNVSKKIEQDFKLCVRHKVGKSETGIWEKCRDQCCFHGERVLKDEVCQLEKDLGLQPNECRAKCYQCKMKNVETAFTKYLAEHNPTATGLPTSISTSGGVSGYNNCLKVSVLN